MAEQQYTTPEDFKSGLADILKEAKNIYEAKKVQGFPTYPGPRIAGFAPEELAAMQGIAGLVGAGQQYFAPAAGLTAGLAEQFTPTTAAQYMSPYQQAVVDVEKREAIRQAQRPRQDIGAAAVGAGSFGGSRQAILEAEQQRNLQRQLGDIQTRGSQAAYETGLRAFEAQKARERQAASGLASLGQVAPRQSLAELTALSGVGEAQRGMTQQGLDIGYQEFQRQQQYPYDLLGQYQATLYGYPYQSFAQYQPTARPSAAQNLAGVLGAVGKIAGPSGFGFFKSGGSIAYRSEGGLSGLTKNMQAGTMVGDTDVTSISGLDPNKSITGQVTKSSLIDALMKMQTGLSDYSSAMEESLKKQSEIAQAEKERLEKQTSPIDYISDLLIGFAAADPEAGTGAQAAAAAEYASSQREEVQNEIRKLERDLAAGNLSEAEAALKLRQLQATSLGDIYDITKGTTAEASEVNALRRIAADRLGATYDPTTDTLTGTPEQKKAVASLLRRMLQAFSTGGYDAAMAVAVEGQNEGQVVTDDDAFDAASDAAADEASNLIGKIQELDE